MVAFPRVGEVRIKSMEEIKKINVGLKVKIEALKSELGYLQALQKEVEKIINNKKE